MPNAMTVRCSNCGQPIQAQIHNVIDTSKTPQLKMQLLSGQLNVADCPTCGASSALHVPLLYHDPAKELLVAYVPMELNMSNDQQERTIGDLMNQLPKENFKGYMFNPKRAISLQGLLDLILESDGVTPEMMQEQRARLDLAQKFMDVETEEDFYQLAKDNDDKIDLRFFQALSLIAQRAAQSGQMEVAQGIAGIQSLLMEISSYGKKVAQDREVQEEVVKEVADEIEALGDKAGRSEFLDIAIKFVDQENHLQALVGLVRPVFDYQFFEELTAKIDAASADEQVKLKELRDKLNEMTAILDQQSQMQVQAAVTLLQQLVNTDESQLDEVIAQNIMLIDDVFLQVLGANIDEMKRRNNVQASVRLKQVYEHVTNILQSQMQPELVFINELLSANSKSEAQAMITEHAKSFGTPLLEVFDAVAEVLTAQGQDELVARLSGLREDTVAALEA